MSKVDWATKACGIFLLWATGAVALRAQTFNTLYAFGIPPVDQIPDSGLGQGTDGSFYGTTEIGGSDEIGTVFRITPNGTLTTLLSFDGSDGFLPQAGLVQGTDGNFYGTTEGGSDSGGTVFKITPNGTLTTLHRFDGKDGAFPEAALVQRGDGNFYGTTSEGGAPGYGTVFKITPGGTLTTLHSFDVADGRGPNGLVQGTDGSYYGTTAYGGVSTACKATLGCGTIFRIAPDGTLTTLYTFGGMHGGMPLAGLVQAADETFYGTTFSGGANSGGTIFRITPSGNLTTIYNFGPGGELSMNGAYPDGALVQANDGSFYGTTYEGGAHAAGTIFKITPSGTLTTLHTFDRTDGEYLSAGLTQGTDGTFYGTTSRGGTDDNGTVFSLSVGLGPFVEMLPMSGKVGAAVKILGTSLTGATSVTFNGTEADFTVDSHSLITTTVPVGVTSGKVHVTVPRGTLSSNVPFSVRP
jgi:uncharacterized repeat protein (TIGR03803 family)